MNGDSLGLDSILHFQVSACVVASYCDDYAHCSHRAARSSPSTVGLIRHLRDVELLTSDLISKEGRIVP